MHLRFLSAHALLATVVPLVARADVRYTVTSLSDLSGQYSLGWTTSQSGGFAGEFFPNGRQHAFYYDGSSVFDLTAQAANSGSFGGYAGASYGLNDKSQI